PSGRPTSSSSSLINPSRCSIRTGNRNRCRLRWHCSGSAASILSSRYGTCIASLSKPSTNETSPSASVSASPSRGSEASATLPLNSRRAATIRQASRISGSSADISCRILKVGCGSVKPGQGGQTVVPTGNLPGNAAAVRLPSTSGSCIVTVIALSVLVVAVAAGLAAWLRRRGGRRNRAMAQLLDAADALEDRLRTARSEIEAIAGDEHNPVREAMQEMLRQRLWLQQHGQTASLEQLDSVRESIEAARSSIDAQLLQIERARAPLH